MCMCCQEWLKYAVEHFDLADDPFVQQNWQRGSYVEQMRQKRKKEQEERIRVSTRDFEKERERKRKRKMELLR